VFGGKCGPAGVAVGVGVCPTGVAVGVGVAAAVGVAVAGVLKRVIGSGEKSLEEAIADERRAVMRTMGTKDQQEGMKAFLEKRKPNFTGE